MVDTGKYNKNSKLYQNLVNDLYKNFSQGVTLPPEYAYFTKENLLQFLVRLARYKFVARLIKKEDTVLEIGSGSGLGCIFLGQHCKQVTGLEIKTTEVEEARAINKRDNVKFIVHDFFDLSATFKYDVIVALDVIEHMPVKLGDRLVAHIARHLNSTGMAVLGTPSCYSYSYQSPLSRASHVKCYDQPELTKLISKYFQRVLPFSMNDEIVHTGYYKLAWYYFMLCFIPPKNNL